jgi:colanic acid/amylovoran biosynthesis protein
MDFFVATRLHSAIYALKAGVPVVAVAYEPKTIGIFKDLDLSEFVLDIRSIDKVGLENKFGRLSMEREKFKLAITKALISANKNINLIADLLK